MSYPHFTGDSEDGVRICKRINGPVPSIICLCGSTKFKDQFLDTMKKLTLDGHLVLLPGLFGHSGDLTPEECERGNAVKDQLDELHFRKIDLSDCILVINVGRYIGESTKREIDYAWRINKPITYLEH